MTGSVLHLSIETSIIDTSIIKR